MARMESLLSARLFLSPRWVGERLYFISDLGGQLSLYSMEAEGGIPQPLLPGHIALQNPDLVGGEPYLIFPGLGKILVMIDADGDENYQPMLLPIEGGFPEPAFGDTFASHRAHLMGGDPERNLVYLSVESRKESMHEAYQGNLKTGELVRLARSPWGAWVDGFNEDHTQAVIQDSYTVGDHVFYLWKKGEGEAKLLYGTPLEERSDGEQVPLNGITDCCFTTEDRGLLFLTALFEDTYGLGWLDLGGPGEIQPVEVTGTVHSGQGEMVSLKHLKGSRYAVEYNIDGGSWLYEGTWDDSARKLELDRVICGHSPLEGGVLKGFSYDKEGDRYALAFSSATSPIQLYTVEGEDRQTIIRRTQERTLGLDPELLSPGEDASFTSHDGLRISARLYRPSERLGFTGPRPLIYYIHGGPQSQERPDFAWFSMPLIQFLTLQGFSVFVPNVRGSTGYGLNYTKRVDRDWGGQDRLDHVHAMQVLAEDPRLDTTRAAVVGRSYGGYMTLTLASRHPELWSAAVDMFGPYDLSSFMERIPETWKPYFQIALGHPEKDRDFLIERSPKTHIEGITCPLLVIQGKNDPRVVEAESSDLVEKLRSMGKDVEYLLFEDEGHDILKMKNRIRCYHAITQFFKEHLRP
ncbi:prolyl oligopeptidase family serine peptidase [Kroppenstedtia eburnea]|uniref:Prolyl oligopeptidase family protein n=1 Tax=Kroppenstedtia eburnea TaxID=714067 RepID=A0A1N7KVD2_9BACL|nr:prolyl oligopeptidase family serine peptidase [Kroppenstedtia eburnea]QKI82792.1 S9 family peptidase [Kroppenstedtia eburnea]SIS65524.1 Prolyl oligopeptidase family protein [Kroppenstedtia eburnea]